MLAQAPNPDAGRVEIPQDSAWKIVLMFAWPAAWFALLIYLLAQPFIPAGGTTPTWLRLLIIVLGTGAELAAGLVLLRREGYRLTPAALASACACASPRDGRPGCWRRSSLSSG